MIKNKKKKRGARIYKVLKENLIQTKSTKINIKSTAKEEWIKVHIFTYIYPTGNESFYILIVRYAGRTKFNKHEISKWKKCKKTYGQPPGFVR